MIDTTKRGRGHIYLRILCLVDAIAPRRRGMTIPDLTRAINAKTDHPYHPRTIRRDLESMFAIGYVTRKLIPNNRQPPQYLWSLNLHSSEHVQKVAMKTLPEVTA